MEISLSTRQSITRWSTPSYRPQINIRCEIVANSTAISWDHVLPWGVSSTTWPSLPPSVLAAKLDRLKKRAGHKHHPFPAAVGTIVHGFVLVRGKIPQIDDANIHQPRLPGAAQYSALQHAREQLGKNCYNIKPHLIQVH